MVYVCCVLMDLAGNPLPLLSTQQTYTILSGNYAQLGANCTGSMPEILLTYPCDGCQSDVDTFTIEFSRPVTGIVGKLIEVIDCGPDLTCSTPDDVTGRPHHRSPGETQAGKDDVTVDYFDVMSERVKYTEQPHYNGTELSAVMEFSLEHMDMTVVGRKYQIVIPPQAFEDDDLNLGPNSTTVVTFTRAPAFQKTVHTIAADSFASDAYDFTLRLGSADDRGYYIHSELCPANYYSTSCPLVAAAGLDKLSVCYCDALKDTTLEDLGSHETTLALHDDIKCSVSVGLSAAQETVIGDRAVPGHKCSTKCSGGCTGPFCYCDSASDAPTADTLCLPASLCREACEGISTCAGIQVHDDEAFCELLFEDELCVASEFDTGFAVAEDWQVYVLRAGAACTHSADFAERAGTLHVTRRVETLVDYVVEPGTT